MDDNITETLVPMGTLALGLFVGWLLGGSGSPPAEAPVPPPPSAQAEEVVAAQAQRCEDRLVKEREVAARVALDAALVRFEQSEAW